MQVMETLPPYDYIGYFNKVNKNIKKYKTIKNNTLGDIFHDANGYRLNINEKMIFDHICKNIILFDIW